MSLEPNAAHRLQKPPADKANDSKDASPAPLGTAPSDRARKFGINYLGELESEQQMQKSGARPRSEERVRRIAATSVQVQCHC